MGHYFGWVGMVGALFLIVGGGWGIIFGKWGRWGIILGRWGWVGHYFSWVGMSAGEWGGCTL